MRKRSASHDLGTFPSPGAPQYRGNSISCQKGWSSERVQPPPPPPPAGGRHIGSVALMTFNSGRTLPSKWEDAERWICSPVSGCGSTNNGKSFSSQPQKRPKSKSGPIGSSTSTSTSAYFSNYHSPGAALEGGSLRNFAGSSPFSTGVLAAERVFGGGGGPQTRMASIIPGCPELRESNGCPSPKVRNLGAEKNEEAPVSRAGSQRDISIQMSPKDCRCSTSSTVGRSSFASSPPALLSIMEQQSDHPAKLEVRDVQVDKGATTIRGSKKRGVRMSKKDRVDANSFHENAVVVSASSFDVSEAAMQNSKWQREDAKITAWENLQKAKAEAAIRELEMKLEKERSATMDRIIDKLRTAQLKANKMRSKLTSDQHDSHDDQRQELPRTPSKFLSFRKHVRIGSLSRFFVCRVF